MEETERGPQKPIMTFVGEITEKPHPILLVIVFIFALWLLALPIFFFTEKSHYPEAVRIYDRVCEAKKAGEVSQIRHLLSGKDFGVSDTGLWEVLRELPCPNRLESKVTFQKRAKRYVEDPDTFELTVGAQSMFFIVEDSTLRWMLKGEPH